MNRDPSRSFPDFMKYLQNSLYAFVYTGEKTLEGGVINHGYVGDGPARSNNNRAARFPSSSDSTSGYYSTG